MTVTIQGIERSVRRRVQLAFAVIVTMVVLVGLLVLHPEHSRASDAFSEVERLRHESGSIVATESRLEMLDSELQRRHQIEHDQLRDVPSGSDESGLADALALSVDDGVASSWSVRMLEPEPVATTNETTDWMSLPAVIEMEGRFEAVVEALRRVENSDRLVRVRMLRVSRPRGNSGQAGMIDASIELDTVFVREQD